ncbi:DUF5944 family protein [Streptomyces niveus]|uniref:DUF5944 family protein n=1 Tax=Streptomyces niveus TaxID=193462 RepID=UPI0034400DED
MASSFLAYPSLSVVRNDDFADTADIAEAFARHVTSRQLPSDVAPVQCSVESEAVPGGVRLRFTSTARKLAGPATVTHKFFFIDRDESRERRHLLTPVTTAATTELLVLFEEGQERDYFHGSVFDSDNLLLASSAVVFDREGRHVPYPFTQKYICPQRLAAADFEVTRDANGRRVARFSLACRDLTETLRLSVAWETIGVVHQRDLVCTPERPATYLDMPLDDNDELAPGDWVVIAVDDRQRLLAQTVVTLVSTEAGRCPS